MITNGRLHFVTFRGVVVQNVSEKEVWQFCFDLSYKFRHHIFVLTKPHNFAITLSLTRQHFSFLA